MSASVRAISRKPSMDRLGSHSTNGGIAGTRLANRDFLSEEELAALDAAVTASRMLDAGAALGREGEPTDSLYVLTTGWACRYKTTREGARQMPALLVPGDVCNLDNLMFGAANYGVRTLTPATVLTLPRERALALSTRHPGIARTFTWLALVENAILSQWALCLGRQSARARLAHLLCEMSVRLGCPEGESECRFDLPLTQEQIADVLGLTSVHVNRTIQQLRTERLVTTDRRMMTIRDVAELRKVGEFDPAYLHDDRDEPGLRAGRSPTYHQQPSGAASPLAL